MRRKSASPESSTAIAGRARVGRRAEQVAARAKSGDIIVIDHVDLDRAGAQALLAARPAAVVNAAATVSGRFPAVGAETLAAAEVPLLDAVGGSVLTMLADGDPIRIDGVRLLRGEDELARGRRQDPESVADDLEHARAGLVRQVSAFADATAEYLGREQDLLAERTGVPETGIDFTDRDVLVVGRGPKVAEQLKELKSFIRDRRPLVIGLPGGADALQGKRMPVPDLLVGDPLALPEAAMRRTPTIVVPGGPTLDAEIQAEHLGLRLIAFPGAVGSEDAALLLADTGGARSIVLVGEPISLSEFLDRGRSGMAGSFLTRLVAGARVVEGPVAAELHRRAVPAGILVFLAAAGLLAVAAAVGITPVGQEWLDAVGLDWLTPGSGS